MGKIYPFGFNPENKLSKKTEALISQAMYSRIRYEAQPRLIEFFTWSALHELVNLCDEATKKAAEGRMWILIAHINTEDIKGFRKHINYWFDWERQCPKGLHNISKFIPGEHFHTMGTKFNSMEEAVAHIEKNGGIVGRIIEKHFYSTEGD